MSRGDISSASNAGSVLQCDDVSSASCDIYSVTVTPPRDHFSSTSGTDNALRGDNGSRSSPTECIPATSAVSSYSSRTGVDVDSSSSGSSSYGQRDFVYLQIRAAEVEYER